MRKVVVVAVLGLVVGGWGCDKSGKEGSEHEHAQSEHDHEHGEGDHEHGGDHDHESDHDHAKGDHDHEGDHDHAGSDGDGPNYAEEGTVEVPAAGKNFEPPVAVDRLPAGTWYCDMGKAPWAASEKPKDGCPVEGAPLKQVGGK
ncbi:MAG: hypothetical protein ABEN55_07950 [Bradymonadaceae bacterium]